MATSVLCNLATFAANPVGRACAKGNVLIWWPHQDLHVSAAWGHVDEADAAFFAEASAYDVSSRSRPYRSMVDFRFVTEATPQAFVRFYEFLSKHRDAFAKKVIHSAVVEGATPAAAQLLGSTKLLRDPFPETNHATREAALARLNITPQDAAALCRTHDALLAEARQLGGLWARVLVYLRDHLRDASLEHCGRTLGVSTRSLQRQLADQGTTFREALGRARIDEAKHLLARGDLKIQAVADAVGLGGAAQLSVSFKRFEGVRPSEWQRRQTASR